MRSLLNSVRNAPVKDGYELRKTSNSKFLLELVQAVFSELQGREMLDQEGMWMSLFIAYLTLMRSFGIIGWLYS